MKYERYKPSLEQIYSNARDALKSNKRACRRTFGKSLKKVSRTKVAEWGLQTVHQLAASDMERLVYMEEWDWMKRGSHIYFPVPGLITALLKSKMDVEVDDFDLPSHPFIVAIPETDKEENLLLAPFMVHYANGLERRDIAAEYAKIIDAPLELERNREVAIEEKRMHVTAQTGTLPGLGYVQQRIVAPMSLIEVVLRSAREGEDEIEAINRVGLNKRLKSALFKSTDEEARMQFAQVKLAIHLGIYMQAFPEAIRDGFPTEFKERDGFRPTPRTLGETHFGTGTHRSPNVHWRTWHFRSYPRRRDGSKRPGKIFIGGSVVGRGTPHTISKNSVIEKQKGNSK